MNNDNTYGDSLSPSHPLFSERLRKELTTLADELEILRKRVEELEQKKG